MKYTMLILLNFMLFSSFAPHIKASPPSIDNAYCILGFATIGCLITGIFALTKHYNNKYTQHINEELKRRVAALTQEIALLKEADTQKDHQITMLQEENIELKKNKILRPQERPPLPTTAQLTNKDYQIPLVPL